MRKLAIIVILALVTSVACTSSRSEYASVTLPTMEIALERVPSNDSLAEYHRKLILRTPGSEDIVTALGDDTGGYSRTNLYLRADGTVTIRDAWGAQVADPVAATVVPISSSSNFGVFLGCFDVDNGRWTYIPSAARQEFPTAFQGG